MPLLVLLALCNLVIGTGAFILTGILEPVADDLGIGVAAAGQAMSAYAIATAVLAPLALLATGRWPRRRALWVSMAVFGCGNLICALAPNLGVLLAGRVVMGLGAMFTPVAASIAVASVEPARRGRALSVVFLGVSLSYVVGLPLGAWLGLRFGWQAPVAVVAVASVICILALFARLPKDIQAPGASFAGLPQVLRKPAVLQMLGLTLLYFTAIFLVFSYVGPVLQALVPMNAAQLSFTLMLFGLSGVVGTLLGGWESDRFGAVRTLAIHLVVLAVMMALVPLTAGQPLLMVLVFVIWGVAGFGMMTPQQSRLAGAAPSHAPLLLSLNSSMLYLGTAAGAAVGGLAATWVGFAHLAWVGLPFALAGLAVLGLSARAMPSANTPGKPRTSP
jgi:MFS transporter, DHA1 family, inner membrane transport protein